MFILFLFLGLNSNYGQVSKDDQAEQFCNDVKQLIIAQETDSLQTLLSDDLIKDSVAIIKQCERYGKYIDSHLLDYTDYWGNFPYSSTPAIHYGFRWSSSQDITKCLIEIVCELNGDAYVITQIIFKSKIGSLPSRSFPEGVKSVFPLN